MMQWLYENISWSDVWNNVLANIIWVLVITIPVAILSFIFWDQIKPRIQRFFGITDNNIPILSFETEDYDKDGDRRSRVVIKNHGREPAYNVYVFLYNYHIAADKSAILQSLGEEGISLGVLAEGQSVVFDGKAVVFESCGVTAKQEVWVEYDNKVGAHLRTRIIPPTPRGDDRRVLPPKYVKKRLEMFPASRITFNNKDRKRLAKGRRGLFLAPNRLHRLSHSMKVLFLGDSR